nr:MAG TPA: hypothetical protein [Caudoviricetes sp.]
MLILSVIFASARTSANSLGSSLAGCHKSFKNSLIAHLAPNPIASLMSSL